MKKKSVCIIMVTTCMLLLFGCGIQQNSDTNETSTDNVTYGGLFTENTVATINIEISDSDWEALLADSTAEQYYSANVTINGETISNVGFRTKGFSSLTSVAQSDSDRYGFKIKFDKYVDDQTFSGLNMCVLNASFSDPSYMREYLTYQSLSYLGASTPKTEYTSLYVNGELYGLYLCIEAVDDSFVERTVNTSATDTNLYKAASENCTLKADSDITGFELKYGDDDKLSNISNLIEILNGMPEGSKGNIENILDVDSVLQSLAVNTVMGNYDSYSGSKAHNYYLKYSEGKFTYIPWDFNMSIGGFSEDNGASVTADVTQAIYNVSLDDRPLIKNLLAVDEYYQKYLEYMNKLISYYDNLENQVNEVASFIRTYVENDPTSFYDSETFETNIVGSDADLTTVTAGSMGGGGNMQIPDGTSGDMQIPDETSGDMQIPDGASGDMQKPDGTSGDMQKPDGTSGTMQQPNGGGSMINNSAVSIIDYITQRIEQIKLQLE